MKTIALKPQKLTPEGFSQFGEVVSAVSNDFFTINNGFARKYANLANVDTSAENGRTSRAYFCCQKTTISINN